MVTERMNERQDESVECMAALRLSFADGDGGGWAWPVAGRDVP